MNRAIYAGSFDPITLGHVNIVERLSPLFSELFVLVANSLEKKYMFKPEERANMATEALGHLKNVKVEIHSGLTVDFAKAVGASIVLRGVRAISDFENEMAMASMNSKLNPKIETMIVFAKPEFSFISSRLVKEVGRLQGNLEGLVPTQVKLALEQSFTQRRESDDRK